MHASGGTGYCDCGDVEAWSAGTHCERHQLTSAMDIDDDSERNRNEKLLPSDVEQVFDKGFTIP